MIITLKKADFSSNNIGTLTTWSISTSYNNSAVEITSGSIPSVVDRTSNTGIQATLTIKEGYELGSAGVTVTMGGSVVSSGITVNGNTITINITSVTGNVSIIIPTKNTTTGEEDDPENPTNYTFTINPTPTSATVTLTASGYTQNGNSITVPNGTTVSWSVSADGYTAQKGTWTANGSNKTLPVTLTATSGGGGSALDLNTLSLAHCSSSKLGTGDKENLTYNQTTHELKVNKPGWYKVSYFTTPVQVGTEIEYTTNYSTSNTGNFVGIYKQEDLVDGIAEANGSFWPAPSGFGVYAPGQGGNDFIFIWDKKNAKVKTADGLEGDYFNKKTIKLKLLATGTEVYVDGVKLTWASGATAATLTEGVNYYLGFHNNNSSGSSASTVASQTITYIGPIR